MVKASVNNQIINDTFPLGTQMDWIVDEYLRCKFCYPTTDKLQFNLITFIVQVSTLLTAAQF